MPDFRKRSTVIELMDDLNCSGDVVKRTLHELEVINKWLGGNAVTMDGLRYMVPKETEIVLADLGCGRGDMLLVIDAWAQRRGYKVRLLGFDANPNIIEAARHQVKGNPRITFHAIDIFSPSFKDYSFDIVTGTLFYHHFTSAQLIDFFSALRRKARIGLLINDIHRHPLAYYSIKYLTRWFSRSPMVQFDAPTSVMRAFQKKELEEILLRAGFTDTSIRWKWAFRWQAIAWR
jgi:ubiquinone/menaquinone biosynthesis C-methylase UbiE